MRILNRLLLVVVLVLLACPAFAGAKDPLFINLTSDDSHRALMPSASARGKWSGAIPSLCT